MPGTGSSKAIWRRWVRDRRQPVSDETTVAVIAGLLEFIDDLDKKASAVMMRAAEHAVERRGGARQGFSERSTRAGGQLILFYRAMADELSLDGLADGLGWQRFAVTRTPPTGPLTLHPAIGAMERHRYGFPQPTAEAFELQPRHISLALVPGVAFDRHGTRLGHGVGYFDELLARLPDDCPRVGVAPSELVFDRLPSESHDVPMTHIATEEGVVAVGT